jgi:precorrin-6x reductase
MNADKFHRRPNAKEAEKGAGRHVLVAMGFESLPRVFAHLLQSFSFLIRVYPRLSAVKCLFDF